MKNLLKDNKLVLNLILTIICSVIFIASLLLYYGSLKDLVAVSGPLGDTFGGLFSPIIGLITILLVYRTFQDQRTSNAHSKSATDFDLLLKVLERHYQSLYIEFPESFKDTHNPAGKDAPPNGLDFFLYTDGTTFLNELIDKLSSLTHLIESTDAFDLTSQHKTFFFSESKIVLGRFFKLYHPIAHTIHDKLRSLPEKEEPYLDEYVKTETKFEINRISFNSRVNSYSSFLLSYHNLVERLKISELIQTADIETASAKDFFTPEPISFDLIKKIKDKKRFDIKITSPTK